MARKLTHAEFHLAGSRATCGCARCSKRIFGNPEFGPIMRISGWDSSRIPRVSRGNPFFDRNGPICRNGIPRNVRKVEDATRNRQSRSSDRITAPLRGWFGAKSRNFVLRISDCCLGMDPMVATSGIWRLFFFNPEQAIRAVDDYAVTIEIAR